MCVLEGEIIDLFFHFVQAGPTLHVLSSALGIQLPVPPLPIAHSDSSDGSNSFSLSSPDLISQGEKPPNPEK